MTHMVSTVPSKDRREIKSSCQFFIEIDCNESVGTSRNQKYYFSRSLTRVKK
jgi:hypothetical protein